MSCLSLQKLFLIGLLAFGVAFNVVVADPVEAKKRRRKPAPSPVKIMNVGTSPEPFVIGRSPLKISMTVQLPRRLHDSNVLEVSALITSTTRRSMGFVSHRMDLKNPSMTQSVDTFPVELVWDGKDQYDRLVPDGPYFYEIQAKLMKDNGDGPRTKVVSRRVHGTLEALAYEGEILPPVSAEAEVDEDVEEAPSGVLEEEDTQIVEEGLKVTEGAETSENENNEIIEEETNGSTQQTMTVDGDTGPEVETDAASTSERTDHSGMNQNSDEQQVKTSTPVPSAH